MTLYQNILETIGRTPMIPLRKVAQGLPVHFYAKYEAINPGGSIKDRIAVAMLEHAEKTGALKPGGTIIEATAGNTGVGLALVGAVKGYRCIFVMPDKMSREKMDLLRAYGAEVVTTETNVSVDHPRYYVNLADQMARELPGSWRANQFKNMQNVAAHYHSTGPEIWQDLGGKVDGFVCGVGTGGCLIGVGKFLKEKNPNVEIILADPVGSTLSDGPAAPYKVEGIGQDYFPATYDQSVVDAGVYVSDQESFAMARRLTREEGLMVGGSSGTHMVAALKWAEFFQSGSNVVVMMSDTGRNYLGRMFNDEWMKREGFSL